MTFYLTSYTKNVVHNNVNNVISLKKNKEKLSKKARERYQIFLKKKETKRTNMLVNDIEIFLKKK